MIVFNVPLGCDLGKCCSFWPQACPKILSALRVVKNDTDREFDEFTKRVTIFGTHGRLTKCVENMDILNLMLVWLID